MAKRRRDTQSIGEYEWVLASGDEANQGEAAGFVSGVLRPMGADPDQVFIGFFAQSLTGDGTKKVSVRVPGEVEGEWLLNSSSDPLAASDIGSDCYAEDGRTVAATDATGTLPKAGRVLDFAGGKVLVQTYPHA